MKIIAKMTTEDVLKSGWHCRIPIVQESDHQEYVVGTRFDWGFVQVALDQGYEVIIKPDDINQANCKHPAGFDVSGGRVDIGSKTGGLRLYMCPICHEMRGAPYKEHPEKNLPVEFPWRQV